MNNWEKVLISPDTQIQKAIQIIDLSAQQIAVVVDQNRKLLGTVTDGDIRRGILRGLPLDQPVSRIMNGSPMTIPRIDDKRSILSIMKANNLRHLPIVDDTGRVIGIEKMDELLQLPKKENWVVIMAGGLGSRLRPLTDDCPKPMLRIGGKPVLETILDELMKQGYSNFCLSINYRSEQIIEYFGDGSKWGIELDYIIEKTPLGTAGSLSQFHRETDKPIIVINGDILTKLSFCQLLDFHVSHKAGATVAVSAYDFQVEYGVVKLEKDMLVGFEEKPVYASFINAGIYVLNPDLLNSIPKNTRYDMNQLLEEMLKKDEKVCAFPVREYWIDIGKMSDFSKALLEYNEVFT